MQGYYLLIYTHAFATVLFAYGYLLGRDESAGSRRSLRFLYWLGAAGMQLGAVLFPLINLGRNIALTRFNMFGIDVLLYSAIFTLLVGAFHAVLRKRFHPGGTIALFAAVQVGFALFLKLYYARI